MEELSSIVAMQASKGMLAHRRCQNRTFIPRHRSLYLDLHAQRTRHVDELCVPTMRLTPAHHGALSRDQAEGLAAAWDGFKSPSSVELKGSPALMTCRGPCYSIRARKQAGSLETSGLILAAAVVCSRRAELTNERGCVPRQAFSDGRRRATSFSSRSQRKKA